MSKKRVKYNIWRSNRFGHLMYNGNDTDHPLYKVWRGINEACSLPSNKAYQRNISIGIDVCLRWKRSFPFFVLDMGNKPTPDHYLKRKNNRRGYDKDNCYWGERKAKVVRNVRVSKPIVKSVSVVPSMFE